MLTFLLNVNASLSIFITAFYWLVSFPSLSADNRAYYFADKVLGHGLVPALVATDLLLFSTRRLRWIHAWQPLSVGAAYLAFSYLYYLLGGRGYVRYSGVLRDPDQHTAHETFDARHRPKIVGQGHVILSPAFQHIMHRRMLQELFWTEQHPDKL